MNATEFYTQVIIRDEVTAVEFRQRCELLDEHGNVNQCSKCGGRKIRGGPRPVFRCTKHGMPNI